MLIIIIITHAQEKVNQKYTWRQTLSPPQPACFGSNFLEYFLKQEQTDVWGFKLFALRHCGMRCE